MTIREITASHEKAQICQSVLTALPNWFGIPESTAGYVAGVQDKPFYLVYDTDDPVGFVSIKPHNAYTAEIYVMGLLENYHRKGLGRLLVQACEDYCRARNMMFLTVKTLDETNPDPFYKRTRFFYEAMGFKPLETFPLLWDAGNPCLFMAKVI